MTTLDDVIAWGDASAAKAVGERFPGVVPPDAPEEGALRERAMDALRPERIAAWLASPEARRAAVPLYLEASHPEIETAYRAARREALAPWNGQVDAALAAEADPRRRAAIARAFSSAIERMGRLAGERAAARDEAAVRAGAADARALAATGREPAADVIAEIERGFVAPTDDAVTAGVRERSQALGLPVPLPPEDVPRMAWMPDRTTLLPAFRLAATLRDVTRALGLPAPHIHERAVAAAPSAHEELAPAALVVLGTWGGPKGLLDVLEAYGRATRATFVRAARGPRARATADPAFAVAAGALFRGIAATPAGLRASGLPDDEVLLEEIRLEKLIDARRAWSRAASIDAFEAHAHASDLRAGARPLSPGEADAARHDDRDPVARLQGLAFAALVEERLLTRFGHAWFARREAGAFLRDLWAAEPEESPQLMAQALALGTMDSAPLLESCQSVKGRAV